jgi:hypothetical protein
MTMADRKEYSRPRRPNPETISYLRSIPLDIELATQEVSHFLLATTTPPQPFPPTLAAALVALDEIQHELASLAGDELAAATIEVLVRITAPYSELAARTVLAACIGYAPFLATHRYGSHVLQTILQLCAATTSDTTTTATASSSSNSNSTASAVSSLSSDRIIDLWRHAEAPTPKEDNLVPSLVDLVIHIQDELSPHALELAVHVCGSHVLRTLICVMGGVELVNDNSSKPTNSSSSSTSFRRGKTKRKTKSREPPPIDEGRCSRAQHLVVLPRPRLKDPAMASALQQLTAALTGTTPQPPGHLQELACHTSAGPLVSVLLRVWTYRNNNNNSSDPNATSAVVLPLSSREVHGTADHHLSCRRTEPRFAMGSEAHALAQRLLCWQQQQQEQKWAGSVIFGLAGEPRGSHALETLLHVSPDEWYRSILTAGDLWSAETLRLYAEDTVSNYVVQSLLTSVRNKEDAAKLLQALLPLISSGFVLDAQQKRRGILWRMVETSCAFRVFQEQILASIEAGLATLLTAGKPATIKLQACVKLLLGLARPERDGDRLILDVAGTRTLYWLLRLENANLCAPILKGLVEMPAEDMELLVKNGLGSRCILDGILEGPVEDPVFSSALSKLATLLAGRWVAISGDRIGHHVVKKLFRSLADVEARESLVKELVSGKKRLSGSSMGRSVVAACLVHEYEVNGAKEWQKLVMKRVDTESWLQDIVQGDCVGEKRKQEKTATDERKKARDER